LGFFPLDQQLELWEQRWSEGLAKEAVWLSGRLPSFEQAEETLARIGHVSMANSTIWRRVKRWGEGFEQVEKERQQAANWMAQLGQVGTARVRSTERLGVGMDGAKIT
jgi:hypothetical protein